MAQVYQRGHATRQQLWPYPQGVVYREGEEAITKLPAMGGDYLELSSADGHPRTAVVGVGNDSVIGLEASGQVAYRCHLPGGYVDDFTYQRQADRLALRSRESIHVFSAADGHEVLEMNFPELEPFASFLALQDGRFAVRSRDQENHGVIATFNPDTGAKAEVTIPFVPLELHDAGGAVVARNTSDVAVVRDGTVLAHSKDLGSHQVCIAEGEVWFLEHLPNRYRPGRSQLVRVDVSTGEVHKSPLPVVAGELFRLPTQGFLVRQNYLGDEVRLHWLDPAGNPLGEFSLGKTRLDQLHLPQGDGPALIVTRDPMGAYTLHAASRGGQPRVLKTSPQWMTGAVTKSGKVLVFTKEAVEVHDPSSQAPPESLTYRQLVERQAEFGEVVSEQKTPLASSAHSVPARLDAVLREVTRHCRIPNPLLYDPPSGSPFLTRDYTVNVPLVLSAHNVAAVTDETLRRQETLRQAVLRPAETLLGQRRLQFQGLPGWELEVEGRRVAFQGPGEEARTPFLLDAPSNVTCALPLTIEGAPYAVMGTSSGEVVWVSGRKDGVGPYSFDLESAVMSLTLGPEGQVLGLSGDGSVFELSPFPEARAAVPGGAQPPGKIKIGGDVVWVGGIPVKIRRL